MSARNPDRSKFLAALLLASSLTVMPIAASPERQVKGPPEVLRAPIDNGESRPVWISALKSVSAVKGADGSQVDVTLLSEREAGFLQARLDVYRQNRSSYPAELLEADPCAGAPPNQADYYVLQPSVEDLAAHSTAIFTARKTVSQLVWKICATSVQLSRLAQEARNQA